MNTLLLQHAPAPENFVLPPPPDDDYTGPQLPLRMISGRRPGHLKNVLKREQEESGAR